jgi:hypothetical protein
MYTYVTYVWKFMYLWEDTVLDYAPVLGPNRPDQTKMESPHAYAKSSTLAK